MRYRLEQHWRTGEGAERCCVRWVEVANQNAAARVLIGWCREIRYLGGTPELGTVKPVDRRAVPGGANEGGRRVLERRIGRGTLIHPAERRLAERRVGERRVSFGVFAVPCARELSS